MVFHAERFDISTEGHGHAVDLTHEVTLCPASLNAQAGRLNECVPGSTAAATMPFVGTANSGEN